MNKIFTCFIFCLLSLLLIGLFSCPYPDLQNNDDPDHPFLTIINGISENMSFIDRRGGKLYTGSIFLGEAPNDIIKYGNEVYVINSGANSVMVFEHADFDIKMEFSIGSGNNPYKACVTGGRIYMSCYQSQKILVYSTGGKKIREINLPVDGLFRAYPQGIACWDKYIFTACIYSKDGGITDLKSKGKVAVYDISSDTLTGFIEAGAANTNSIYIDRSTDHIYLISSGDYDGGFLENGKIEYFDLMDKSADLASPGIITPVQVISGRSFSAICIYDDRSWAGGLGKGTLIGYDISGDAWTAKSSVTFPDTNGLAFIPDIKYDAYGDTLYATEFNGGKLYLLDPDDLGIKRSFDSASGGNSGDPLYMLMVP